MPRYLVTEPNCFDVSYQINPWMKPDVWQRDPAAMQIRARQGSAALVQALRDAGGEIETVPAVPGLPDLVFPANAAIVLDGTVLLARFMHPQRQGEEPVFRAAFEKLQARGIIREIIEFPEGVFQEGAGDGIWDNDRGFFWVGYGQRSDEASIAIIADTFGKRTVPLQLVTNRFYHLDTCFCPLSGGKVLYYPSAFTAKSLETLRAHIAESDRIEATDEDAAAFCVNAVNIGKTIVMAKAPPALRERLSSHGFHVVEVDLSPYILSGGGAYCMTLRLDRESIGMPHTLAAE